MDFREAWDKPNKRRERGIRTRKRPGDKRESSQAAKGRNNSSLRMLASRKMSYTVKGWLSINIRKVTPRRLSFSLEDFLEGETERIDLNTAAGNERLNNERENMYFITPTDRRKEVRTELNLLSGLETPTRAATKESPHTMIPIDVLNNIIMNQQSLVNLVTRLQAQVKEGGAAVANRHVHDQEVPMKHQDDAPVTLGELRRLL
ncbi:hypothetical protein SESBI_27777 [Sesbania bispinosa]|nr:hypothetical protein SESBI_27777 [Sesbania bispinosa]